MRTLQLALSLALVAGSSQLARGQGIGGGSVPGPDDSFSIGMVLVNEPASGVDIVRIVVDGSTATAFPILWDTAGTPTDPPGATSTYSGVDTQTVTIDFSATPDGFDPGEMLTLSGIDPDGDPGPTGVFVSDLAGVTVTFEFESGPAYVAVFVDDPAPGAGLVLSQGTAPYETLCYGDGSGALCGCSNESAPGSSSGCLNSSGFGGALTASGAASATGNTLVVSCAGVLTDPGLVFGAVNEINGGAGTPFGDGIRCCGGGVVRIQVLDPPPGPEPTNVSTTVTIPPAPAGETRCYQYWYRDPGGPCGSSFNLSNAVRVTWSA